MSAIRLPTYLAIFYSTQNQVITTTLFTQNEFNHRCEASGPETRWALLIECETGEVQATYNPTSKKTS